MDKRRNNGGKRENAGRKAKSEELGLPALIDEVVSIEEQKDIIKKLAEKAKVGSYKHIELFLAYKFGKPTDQVNITSDDGSMRQLDLSLFSLEEKKILIDLLSKAKGED